MATSKEENPVLVEQFIAVTGATQAVAISLLEACAGNLDLAVGMHMDGQGAVGPSSYAQGDLPSASSASASASASTNNHEDADDVRAPIPQKTEVLVDDDDSYKFASWRMRRPRRMVRSVFDGFRDFQAEAKNYEDGIHGKSASKKRNLEDLFRPPVDITHKGTFQSARDLGSLNNQWLLVNVQNVQEFECQVLNRDVWSCQAAKNLITSNFIFWQVYNDSAEGKRFMQFYKVSRWPYVAIVDPFTGENQVAWNKVPDGKTFCELCNEFLAMHPTPNKSESPPSKRQKQEASIVDASEQDQMEAAILASLEASKPKPSKSPLYVIDSDSEPDLIEDSEDEVETFSDSGTLSESTPVCKTSSSSSNKHAANSVNVCSTSTSSSSTSTSSSIVSSKLHTHQITSNNRNSKNLRNNRKDSYSKCKNLSASKKTSVSYSPSSPNPDSGVVSSGVFSSSNECNDHADITSLRKNSLSVNDDNSLSDTLETKDGETCAIKDLPCSSHTSDVTNRLNQATASDSLDWKHYWGDETDPMCKIMMRFPDSRREQVQLPCSSSLKALKTYCTSLGFTEDKYELVTNFPRRQLSDMDDSKVLKDIGLYPQDTVFIQEL